MSNGNGPGGVTSGRHHEMHRGLGELYVNDPRFAANYEKVRPGLAEFTRDAFRANAERASR